MGEALSHLVKPCRYSDYVRTESGLQYQVLIAGFVREALIILAPQDEVCESQAKLYSQDIREGQGDTPKDGSNCAIDWDGYTIGYYVRKFAFGLPQSFAGSVINLLEAYIV